MLRAFCVGALLLFLLACATSATPSPPAQVAKVDEASTAPQNVSETTVARVIDGDTFELSSGERVRLLCIDTPEQGKPHYEDATRRLSDLVLGKDVTLEKDVSERDRYGRLLRYVYVENFSVNAEMIRSGYAAVYRYPPDVKHCDEYAAIARGVYEENAPEEAEETISEEGACTLLGCPKGAIAVGSVNSDKWHYCHCRYASRIYKENLLCFFSTREAEAQGYIETKVC